MSKPDLHLVDADHEIEQQFRLVMAASPAALPSSPRDKATTSPG
ncbi:hypothetical protein [Bradyrhizobium septentrionale]|nr:hypothetical protein [Bradyrhizobium septentrionale]